MSAPAPYTLYTDGACSGNPGPGGWAFKLTAPDGRTETRYGGESRTTNNRMEMTAAIEGLRLTPPGSSVVVYTDSTYLRDGASKWIHKWRAAGFTRGGEPIPNSDLWKALDKLMAERSVRWMHVRGHSGLLANDEVDALARKAIGGEAATPARRRRRVEAEGKADPALTEAIMEAIRGFGVSDRATVIESLKAAAREFRTGNR